MMKLPQLTLIYEKQVLDFDAEKLKKSFKDFIEDEIEWFDTLKNLSLGLKKQMTGEPTQRLAAARGSPKLARSKSQLKNLVKKTGDWKDWYQNNINFLKRIFGEDEENLKMFTKILAATSQGASVAANVSLAISALRTTIVDGKSHTNAFKGLSGAKRSLSSIAKGGDPMGPKVGPFGKAMAGDPGAVAVDRHIFEILFDSQNASKGKRQAAYDTISQVAEEMGLENRQIQAALWAANQIRKGATPGNYIDYIDKRRHELQKVLDDVDNLDVQRVSGLFADSPEGG